MKSKLLHSIYPTPTSVRSPSFPFLMPPGLGSFLSYPWRLHWRHGRGADARSRFFPRMTLCATGSIPPCPLHRHSHHSRATAVQPQLPMLDVKGQIHLCSSHPRLRHGRAASARPLFGHWMSLGATGSTHPCPRHLHPRNGQAVGVQPRDSLETTLHVMESSS